MSKKKKVRVDLRKNRTKPPRQNDLTRGFQDHAFADEATLAGERVRAKGDLSRRRTIMQHDEGDAPPSNMPAADASVSLPGRVLRVHGLWSVVEVDDGQQFRCAVRRLLKQIVTDSRSIVTTGDRVWFRPVEAHGPPPAGLEEREMPEGLIERVEPRHGVLTRASRRREHVLVGNVDQLVIVMSVVEPALKPHLIDRYIACAERGGLTPIICLNKADLVDPDLLQPLIGSYSQLGILAFLTSTVAGQGIELLRRRLVDRATVFSGQSGVGKSSLLNAVQPGLALRVSEVSDVNQKGKHTTTNAQLIKLDNGGWVVDTPGLRQLQLWDTRPEEFEGLFAEFRPFVTLCQFPDCTHIHEAGCGVIRAVTRRQISPRRYTSYMGLFTGTT
jgi:ribosome biogenesis GTPase / thiamine phosphate phosphatase